MEPSVPSVDHWDSPGDPGQRGFVSPSISAQLDDEASLMRLGDKGTERVTTSGGDAGTVLGKEPGGMLSEKNAGKGPGGTPSEKNAGKGSGGTPSELNAGKEPYGTPSENIGKGPGGTLSEKNAGKGPSGMPSEKNAGKEPSGTSSENSGKGPGSTPSENAGKETCGTPSEKNAGVVEDGGSVPDLNRPGLAAPVRELPMDNDDGRPAGADKDRGDARLLQGAANGAEASGALHSYAAPLVESNSGGEVACVPVVDSEVEVADTVEVEVPVVDILDVEVPLTESSMEVEAAPVPQGVEVEMEVQVADMVEVEVPTADNVEDLETTPMEVSESEPTVETVAMETGAAEDAPGVETADSEKVVEDTSNVEVADSEAAVETTAPAEDTSASASDQFSETRAEKSSESACIQRAESPGDVKDGLSEPVSDAVYSETVCQEQSTGPAVMESAATPRGAVETTPAKESCSVETAPAKESHNVETTPAKESRNVETAPAAALETTPVKESHSGETAPAKESHSVETAPAAAVETTPAKESCSVETAPAKESCSVETTPAKESCSVETTPVKDSSTVETAPAKESHSVETTPAKESCNVETAPAAAVETTPVKESHSVETAAVETTPAKESCSVETTPAKESCSVEITPAKESCSVETTPVKDSSTVETAPAKDSSTVETTPAKESCTVETAPAAAVETTPAQESCSVETTPAKESRNMETTPAKESGSVETTPAKESCNVETSAKESCNVEKAPATESCKQPEAGAEDGKMKILGVSSHHQQLRSPDAAALSAGRETALMTTKPRTCIEGKATVACSAPTDATNPRTSDAEDDETSPAGQAVTPSTAKVESSASDVTSEVWPSPHDASCWLTLDAEGADRSAVKEPQEEGGGTPEKVEPQKRGEVGGVADSVTCGTEVGNRGAKPVEAKKTGIAGNDVSSRGSSQKAFGVWEEEIGEKGDSTAERVPSLAGTKIKGDGSGVDVNKTRTKGDSDDVGASETKTKGAGDGVGTSKTQTVKDSNDIGTSKTQTKNDSDGIGASKTQTKKDGNDVGVSKTQTQNDSDGVGASKIQTKKDGNDVGVSKTQTKKDGSDVGVSKTQTQNDGSDVGASKTNKTKGDGVDVGTSKTIAKSGDGDVGTSKTKTRSGDDDAGMSKTKDCAKEGDEGAADRPGHADNRPGEADKSGFGSARDADVPAQMGGKADGKKQDVAAASTSPHSDGKSSASEKAAEEEAQPKLSHAGREDSSSSQVSAGDGRRNSAFKRSSSHERFGNIFDKFSQGGGLAEAVNVTACKRIGGNGGPREEQVSNDGNLSKGSPAEPKPHCPVWAEDLKREGRGEEREEQSSGSNFPEEQEADRRELGRRRTGDSSRTVDVERSERDPESCRTGPQGGVKRGESSKSKATLTVDSQSREKNASVCRKDEAQEIKVDGNKKHSEGARKSEDGYHKLNKSGEEADEGEDDSDEEKEVRAKKERDENSLADSPAQEGVKPAPTSKTSRADKNSNTYNKEADDEDGDEDDEVSINKEAEVSAQSKLTPGQSEGDASSGRDADSVDLNQATQASFSDESSSESSSDDEEETVVKHNSVDHDFIFTDGKGEEEEEQREDGAEEEVNASDEKRSVHLEAVDRDPGTPQFQFSRLKTCKTYSRKSELTLANPDDLDVSESEESDDSEGQHASPVARALQRSSRTRENGDVKEGAAVPASRSLWKVEETLVVQDPSKSKPSIVSRITKALTSVPRNLGGAVPAASVSRDVGKARPMSGESCGLRKVKTPPQTLRVRSNPLPPDPRAKPKGRQRTLRKEEGGGGDRSVIGVSTKVDVFECSVCGKEFNALNRYRRHERSHSSGKRFCCDVCGKLFESQDKLDIHRQVHLQSSNGTFTCPHCGEICKKWRPFLYHLSKHQADGGKKYTCQLCGHTLFAADRLRRHTKHHKQGLNFCCFTCGKLFLTQERLDTHTAVHSSGRPAKPPSPPESPAQPRRGQLTNAAARLPVTANSPCRNAAGRPGGRGAGRTGGGRRGSPPPRSRTRRARRRAA